MANTSNHIEVEDEWFEEELTVGALKPENELKVDTSSSSEETSFNLPSEFLQSMDLAFSMGSKEFYLNNSGTKRLIIGISCPVMPNIKVVFKLYDLKNEWYIEFNKKVWDSIVSHEEEISGFLYNDLQGEIFCNNQIRVAVHVLFDQMCVQFSDNSGTNITLASDTFERMMSLRSEIETTYNEVHKKVKDVTKRVKLFMDLSFFLLFKSNNIDNRHNYNWLMLMMDKNSEFQDLSNSIASTWKKLGKWIGSEEQATVDA